MRCPRCNKEAEGKFCCHCGAPLYQDFQDKLEKWLDQDIQGNVHEQEENPGFQEEHPMYESGSKRRTTSSSFYKDREEYQRGYRESAKPVSRYYDEFEDDDYDYDSDLSEKWDDYEDYPERRQSYDNRGQGKYQPADKTIVIKDRRGRAPVRQSKKVVQKKGKTSRRPQTKVIHKTRRPGALQNMAATGVSKTISHILRLAAGGLMTVIVLTLLTGFWREKDTLGAVTQMIAERNLGEALFLILSLATVIYGALSILWLFTRRKMAQNDRITYLDTGRGTFSFLVFFLLSFVGGKIVLWIPGTPQILAGFRLYLLVIERYGGFLTVLSVAGLVCCLIRRWKRF